VPIWILFCQLFHVLRAQRDPHTFLSESFPASLDVGMHAPDNHFLLGALLVAGEASRTRSGAHTLLHFVLAFIRVRPLCPMSLAFLAQLPIFGCDAVLHKLLLREQLKGIERV
jgi:hypothetical protein